MTTICKHAASGCNGPREGDCLGLCAHNPARRLLERDVEAHLVKRVKALGGEVRKVQWVGRSGAPDRVVMWRARTPTVRNGKVVERPATIWVELKNPETIKTFPANAHERAQHREHERMRAMGQRVEVIGTIEQVEELLG